MKRKNNGMQQGTLKRKNRKCSVDDRDASVRALVTHLQECILIIDKNGIILFANEAFRRLLNIHDNDCGNKHIRDCIAKNDTARLMRIIHRSDPPHKEYRGIVLHAIKRDGATAELSCRIFPVPYGGETCHIVSAVDQTPSIEMNSKMEHLQHLASIGTFSSGIVHEFNNVLTGIRGYAQLADKDLTNTRLLEKAFTIIEAECQRGAELCKNMSLYSSRTKINPEPVMLRDLAETVLSLQKRYFQQEKVTIEKQYDDIPDIMIDKFQIQQVILNLIINARHAILQKGYGTITVRIMDHGKTIHIDIEDTGIGIEEKNIRRIFDPFYTSKGVIGLHVAGKEIKGSGLGLSVSSSIIRKHGGEITVSSVRGKGSCFTVILPKIIANMRPQTDAAACRYPLHCKRKPLKILVVDDEISIRELLFKALTAIEMEVILARNAEEAIAYCKSDLFDIVFLDYILPEQNGDNLIPVIKEHLPQAKIIMISGWVSSPIKKKKLEKNVDAWIDKPFDVSQIFSCINDIAPGDGITH